MKLSLEANPLLKECYVNFSIIITLVILRMINNITSLNNFVTKMLTEYLNNIKIYQIKNLSPPHTASYPSLFIDNCHIYFDLYHRSFSVFTYKHMSTDVYICIDFYFF